MSTASPDLPGSPAPTAVADGTGGSSGKATASLVLGIIGIVLIPIIAPIAAILLGQQAKSEIAASQGMSGRGLAQAGVVLGWVSLALTALFILLVVIVGVS